MIHQARAHDKRQLLVRCVRKTSLGRTSTETKSGTNELKLGAQEPMSCVRIPKIDKKTKFMDSIPHVGWDQDVSEAIQEKKTPFLVSIVQPLL